MNYSVQNNRLMEKAEQYIRRNRPAHALRLLSSPALCREPQLPVLLNRVWPLLSDRRLAAWFHKTAATLFPAEVSPDDALARLCLPRCTDVSVLSRLVRSIPRLQSLSADFHRTAGELATAGSHAAAADHYRTAVWIDEALPACISPSRCCWAAALYTIHRYTESADAFAPCADSSLRQPLPPCYSGLAQILSAEQLIARSNCEPALEILRRLSEISAPFPGVPSMARALEGCGQHREAAEQWRIAADAADAPARIFFLRQCGISLRNGGFHDEACACFADIRQQAGSDPLSVSDAWLNESLCAFARHRYGEEITCCLNALDALDVRDAAHRIRPLRYYADAEYRLHRFESGADHYRQALDCARLSGDVRMIAKIETEWADNLREHAQDYDAAIRHYSASVRIYRSVLPPHSDLKGELAMALNGRGICAFHLRNYKNQIADCAAAIGILSQQPETPETLLQLSACLRNRADSLDRLERFAPALADYRRSAEVYRSACAAAPHLLDASELPELLLCCGRMCDRMDRYDDAVPYYSQVLSHLSDRPAPLTGLNLEYTALAALRRGYAGLRCTRRNFSLALQDFLRVIDLTQDTDHTNLLRIRASAWRQCGELYSAMEQYELAQDAFRSAASAETQLQAAKERISEHV